jgi:hypothetical protein
MCALIPAMEIAQTSQFKTAMKMPSRFLLLSAGLFVAAPLAFGGGKPFDGMTLHNWKTKDKDTGENRWVIGEPSLSADNTAKFEVKEGKGKTMAMVNNVAGHNESWDIYSKDEWGSCRIELEFMVAKGSNSGIYVMGEYEVQIFDSFGKEKLGDGDMGAIYGASPASVNACKPAGEWQKLMILFDAPVFDESGKKTANARFVRVTLNGQEIQKNVEMKGSTGSALTGKERVKGPLMIQGDHGPVAVRNIQVIPIAVSPPDDGNNFVSPQDLRNSIGNPPKK